MEKGIEIIIVCAVLAAAVVGVGIFLTVHFCCQRRNRRQRSPSRSGIAPPSAARGERPRRRADRQGRTRSPASRNGGTERPPLLPSTRPPSTRPGLSPRDELARENCSEWLLRSTGGGRALVDLHRSPMSLSAVSEVSQAAATLNHSMQQHTYQSVPGDSLGRAADEPALEVDACEPPQSPPPPPPPPTSAETRQQRKERQLRRTQELFPGVPVKEEQLYELRAIFSDTQLSRSAVAGVPVPGASVMPHPSSAPPWPPACVHQAAPARTAASAGEGGTFSQWPTVTEGDGALVSFVGPVLTDGGGYGSGFCSGDPAAKQLRAAPSQKTGFARPPLQPHGSSSSISGIVFSASAAADSTAKAVTKQRLPDPLGQTLAPNDECRLPDGSPPPPRCVSSAVGGSGSGALPPPPSTECKTCRAALGQSPSAEPPPPLPPRPSSVVVFDARIRCNRDFEQLPVGGERPDLNIANYLRSLPVEVLERRYPADGFCAAAAAVMVATEEHSGSEQLVKPYCLLGPNSLDTS